MYTKQNLSLYFIKHLELIGGGHWHGVLIGGGITFFFFFLGVTHGVLTFHKCFLPLSLTIDNPSYHWPPSGSDGIMH
jgi:hypothetical protein